eukprot:scaffold134_cov268-Prasinococcus_capsulatus_cf.AAC.1
MQGSAARCHRWGAHLGHLPREGEPRLREGARAALHLQGAFARAERHQLARHRHQRRVALLHLPRGAPVRAGRGRRGAGVSKPACERRWPRLAAGAARAGGLGTFCARLPIVTSSSASSCCCCGGGGGVPVDCSSPRSARSVAL